MAAHMADGDGTPDNGGRTPPVPDEVWHKFLTDSEHAIRETAPKEPSAGERGTGPWAELLPAPREGRRHEEEPPPARAEPESPYEYGAVGELWQSADPWSGRPWRELDGRARCRRVGRVLCTVAAITLILGFFSHLTTSGSPYDGQDDTISQQSDQAPTRSPTTSGITPLPSG
ncbi:hypothetical protein [Streptomyces sp. NPDC057438]|uniref:hypothetical protein n=1 Tax=Streptomyces sp. NPDC057438 TaxID=3346133 RepID=UPI00369B4971